jgi:hypothetical protein
LDLTSKYFHAHIGNTLTIPLRDLIPNPRQCPECLKEKRWILALLGIMRLKDWCAHDPLAKVLCYRRDYHHNDWDEMIDLLERNHIDEENLSLEMALKDTRGTSMR